MTHGKTHEADTKTTHEIIKTHTCLHAIAKTVAMIHARDMDKDMILESAGQKTKTDRFDLSHREITRDKTAKA